MSKVIHSDADLTIVMGPSAGDAPICLCDSHQSELDSYQLEPDQLCAVVRTLFTLAARTLGTIALVKHRCPVCGLQNFNYLTEIIKMVTPERSHGH